MAESGGTLTASVSTSRRSAAVAGFVSCKIVDREQLVRLQRLAQTEHGVAPELAVPVGWDELTGTRRLAMLRGPLVMASSA